MRDGTTNRLVRAVVNGTSMHYCTHDFGLKVTENKVYLAKDNSWTPLRCILVTGIAQYKFASELKRTALSRFLIQLRSSYIYYFPCFFAGNDAVPASLEFWAPAWLYQHVKPITPARKYSSIRASHASLFSRLYSIRLSCKL